MTNAGAFDPYGALGVPRDAAQAAIKAAFRKAASAAHPDRTKGDNDVMVAVNRAYSLIGTPARRKQFDATGSTTLMAAEDLVAQEALQLFAQLVGKGIEEAGVPLVRFLQQATGATLDKISEKRRAISAQRARIEKQAKHIRRKGGGQNIIAGVLAAKCAELDTALAQLNHSLKVASKAARMAAQYEEDAEPDAFAGIFATGDVRRGDAFITMRDTFARELRKATTK